MMLLTSAGKLAETGIYRAEPKKTRKILKSAKSKNRLDRDTEGQWSVESVLEEERIMMERIGETGRF